jgi:hypothetical protein
MRGSQLRRPLPERIGRSCLVLHAYVPDRDDLFLKWPSLTCLWRDIALDATTPYRAQLEASASGLALGVWSAAFSRRE